MGDFSKTQILYEDNHIIVINKNVGDLVQGDKTGDLSLKDIISEFIKQRDKKPGNVFLGVTHRIDRPVSGVVIFAKTSKALTRLNKIFQNKEIDKKYWALVKNKPPHLTGRLEHYLIKNQEKNVSRAYDKMRQGTKKAVLNYKILAESDKYCLLEVDLETGRHHQIRVQLTKIGSPIKGDLKYGYPRSNPDKGISLHARSIEFIHPVKKENIKIIAPVPDNNLWKFFEQNQKK